MCYLLGQESSRFDDNSTRLLKLYSTLPSSVAIVAFLLLIKHAIYHLGCWRNGLSIKTTYLVSYLLVESSIKKERSNKIQPKGAASRRLTYFVCNYNSLYVTTFPSWNFITTWHRRDWHWIILLEIFLFYESRNYILYTFYLLCHISKSVWYEHKIQLILKNIFF